MKHRSAVNAISIEDQKLLLVFKKDVWILPGGKMEENETQEDCLGREIKEELPNTRISILELYGKFEGITPHSHQKRKVFAYFFKNHRRHHARSRDYALKIC